MGSSLNVSVLIILVISLIQICIVNGQEADLAGLANSLGSMFSGIAGVGSGCKHTCPKGQIPKPKKNHKPTYNGCGSYGIEVSVEDMPIGMTVCCNLHDMCYDTCNEQKDDCDKEFSKCLGDVCLRLKTKQATTDCQSVTQIMEAGASMLGCTAYVDAQKEACQCVKNTKSKVHAKDDKKATKSKKDKGSILMPDLDHIFNDEL